MFFYQSWLFLFKRGSVDGTLDSFVAGFVAFLFCCRRCSGSNTAGKSSVGRCGVRKRGRARAELVSTATSSLYALQDAKPTLLPGTPVNGSRNFL